MNEKYRVHELARFHYSEIGEYIDEYHTDRPLRNDEIIDLVNEQDKTIKELEEENKQLKEELGSFEQVSFTDLCDKSRTVLYMKKENVGDVE